MENLIGIILITLPLAFAGALLWFMMSGSKHSHNSMDAYHHDKD